MAVDEGAIQHDTADGPYHFLIDLGSGHYALAERVSTISPRKEGLPDHAFVALFEGKVYKAAGLGDRPVFGSPVPFVSGWARPTLSLGPVNGPVGQVNIYNSDVPAPSNKP